MKATGRLENWEYDSQYRMLLGHIFGDTKNRFPDGRRIFTSEVIISPKNLPEQGRIIETKNSFYLLGKPFKRKYDV